MDAGASTVKNGGGSCERHSTIDAGTMTFNNFTFNKGCSYDATIIGSMDVNGNLIINNTNSGSLLIGGVIQVAGDVTLQNNGGDSDGDTGLTLDGTGAQTITRTGGNWPEGAVAINKPSGVATLGSVWTLNGTGQTLTINSGTLDLAGNNLTVTSSFIIQDGGGLRFQGDETTPTPTLNSGSSVTYTGNQTYAVQNWSYSNLIFQGTGTFNLGYALDLDGNLSISSGTFDVVADTNTINLEGTGPAWLERPLRSETPPSPLMDQEIRI